MRIDTGNATGTLVGKDIFCNDINALTYVPEPMTLLIFGSGLFFMRKKIKQ
jgi:hypothetical protein